jgi:hypothetical protein
MYRSELRGDLKPRVEVRFISILLSLLPLWFLDYLELRLFDVWIRDGPLSGESLCT